MPEDHWSRNEGPVRFYERPTGGVRRACEEFRRSVKESLTGPFQANRSDGIKTGIGIERKKIDLLLFEQMIDFGKNNI